MIIWSGYGFLVFVIVFINSLIANLITNWVIKEDDFYSKNLTPLGISFMVSGVVLLILTDYFDKKKKEGKGTRVFEAKMIAAGDQNKLFFIPFRYWSYIISSLGLGVIIYQYFSKS
jgi:hypothetical protein